MINILITLIVALFLIPAMHGVFLKWHNLHLPSTSLKDIEAERMRQVYIKRYSKVWHRIALALRGFIWLSVWFSSGRSYWITVPIIAITALTYPVIINLINGWKLYFVGTSTWTDKIIRKVFFFVNFDK